MISTTSAHSGSLAGAWQGTTGCDYNRSWLNQLTLNVSLVSGNSYTISGSTVNMPLSGTIEGGRVKINGRNFLNSVNFQGTASEASMSGTYTQSLTQGTAQNCTWTASKIGGSSPAPEAPPHTHSASCPGSALNWVRWIGINTDTNGYILQNRCAAVPIRVTYTAISNVNCAPELRFQTVWAGAGNGIKDWSFCGKRPKITDAVYMPPVSRAQ